ncbi:hypothetical protein H7X65_02410 [Candidatus Parcubacteria bacterium]|nr:hypothetical protein [Candidatus Parcubacteria bacterium]
METRFQTTSFIPKASLDNVVDDHGKIQRTSGSSSGGSSFFILISFFLFICSIVSAGIIFSLNQLDISQKKSANDSLVKSQQSINKETIEEIKSLNSRLGVIQSLINKHVAVSAIFNELSKNTIRQVSFSSFDLKRKTDNTYALSLKAQGVGYESIVAQDAQLSSGPAQKFFKNTSITDFVKSKGQDLTSFGINTSVSNGAINFAEVINNTIN